MATLQDLASRIKELFFKSQPVQNLQAWGQVATNPQLRQEYNQQVIQPKIQQTQQYFNSTSNAGQNFWSTPVAQSLANLQVALEKSRYEMPNVSLESITPQIKTPYQPVNFVANLPINLARGVAEGLINAPANAWQTGARIGYDIVNVPRGEVKLTPQRVLSDIAPGLEAYLSVAGLGLGKQAIKEAGKELVKGSVEQAIKKGALEGALYGGGFGLAEAASSKEFAEKQNVSSLVEPTLTGAAGGALIGAAAMGVPAAIGALFNKVKSAIREIHPNQPPDWVDEQGRIFVRNELGRFVGLKPLVKEEKIPIKQRVYPSGKEPQWYGDVREKIGLPREGLTAENIPVGLSTKPKGGMGAVFEAEKVKPTIPPEFEPLAQEARKYKSAEEFVKGIKNTEHPSWIINRIQNLANQLGRRTSIKSPQEEKLLLEAIKLRGFGLGRDVEANRLEAKALENIIKREYGMSLADFYTQTTKGIGKIKIKAPEVSGKVPNLSGTREGQLGEQVRAILPEQKAKLQTETNVAPTSPITPENLGGSSPPIISDPVQKIINALKEAKPLRGKQEKIYSQIRSQQAEAIAAIGREMKGEETYFKQLGQLKGELPKVQFESIRSKLKQEDIVALFNKIEQSSLPVFEKIHAKSGLAKLLGAEGGAVPQQSELALLNEIFPPEFIQEVLDKRPFLQKLFSLGEEGLNLPRAVMATADLSASLRQGVFLIGRPKQWIPAFGNMFKYAFSENAYKGLLEDIRSRPTYQAMREAKLALTDISPILQGREEAFMSNLVERIPIFGRIARGSNRAYSGFLNKLRADVFDDLYKNAKNLGIIDERPQVVSDIAKFVNSATGRGDLGALNRASVVLNGAFFSPRLMASRLNLLNPVFYMRLDPFVRKEALKSLFTFAGTGLSVLTLAKLGGLDVGTDPRSSDFGKIKIGNTRYDIWGGFQQYFRAAGQIITGQYVSSTTGKEYTLGEGYKPLTRLGILGRVIESKEAPVLSFVSQLLQGQTNLGQPFNVPTEIVNRFIPMVISDMYDLAKEKDSPLAGLLATPGIFGVGVQTYGKQIPNLETTPTGKPTIKLKPIPGLGEDIIAKITGQQPSNIPLEQQQGIVSQIQTEQQKKIQMDKLKQQLEAGKIPTGVPADLDTAKLMFKYSDQPMTEFNNYVLYKDGEIIKTIDTSFQPTPPTLTGNTELDKKAISKFNGEITKKANDIYNLYQIGKITVDDAETQMQALTELKAQYATPKKGRKGRKPAKVTIKKTTMPKIAFKALGKRALPAIKLTKPPKFTVNRARSVRLTMPSRALPAIRMPSKENYRIQISR